MLASLLALAALSPAFDVSFFAECGTLVQGSNCVLFRSESEVLYAISDTGGFSIGERVYATGIWANQATCEPGVDAILEPESLLPAPCTVEQFCGCHRTAPCGNVGDPPQMSSWHGCGNSASPEGASLSIDPGAIGFRSLSATTTRLTFRRLIPNEPFVLFLGGQRAPRTLFGDGLMCIGRGPVGLVRYPIVQADPGGTVVVGDLMSLSAASLPPGVPFHPGASLYFQGWYRDPAGPCGSGSNATPAVKLTLLP